MSKKLPIEQQGIELLNAYVGRNDYILWLQRQLFTGKLAITRNQSKYVIDYYNVEPQLVNKYVEIHPFYGAYFKKQYNLPYEPTHVLIFKILSRKGDDIHIWGAFEQDAKFHQSIYINKRAFKRTKQVKNLVFDAYKRPPKPHQIEAVKTLLANDRYILADDMGLGKAVPLNTPVLTPAGWKPIGELKVGDEVCNTYGSISEVKGYFPQGKKDAYKVTFTDGSSAICCDEHLWEVNTPTRKKRGNPGMVMSLSEIIKKGYKEKNGNLKYYIPITKPVQFSAKAPLIEPYLMGLLLGDGCLTSKSVSITTIEQEIIDHCTEVAGRYDCEFKPKDHYQSYSFSKKGTINKLYNSIKKYGLAGCDSETKFIPDDYLFNTQWVRLAILQGLMDTDGSVFKDGTLQYYTVSKKLSEGVKHLVQSLGGTIRITEKTGSYKKNGVKINCKLCYVHTINLPSTRIPFGISRKRNRLKENKKYNPTRGIKHIERVGEEEMVCISVSSENKLFLINDFIATHNTTSAIIAAVEGGFKKILVVCPASLKLNWKKEISNYENPNNISVVSGGDFTVNKWTIINYDILKNHHHTPQKGVKIEDLPISPIDFHKFDLVIADEAHYLKNATSNRTKIFLDFASRVGTRWLLTGTPITNKPIDFYSLLDICDSPLAENWQAYVKRYCAGRQFSRKGGEGKFWVTGGASNLDELRRYTQDLMLRRTKKELDLPPKSVKPVYLPLTMGSRYSQFMREYELWVEELEAKGETLPETAHLTKLTAVRQLLAQDKVEHTIKMAEDLIEEGHKVIIFSCFTSTIHQIHEHFGKASVIIDGSVSSVKRQAAVDKFQESDKIKVFCGNIVAAGVGLTLTAADVVIFNDLDFVPANHAQAEDRAHRIGQEKEVHIIYNLVDDTIDQYVYDILQRKKAVIEQVLGDDLINTASFASELVKSLKQS